MILPHVKITELLLEVDEWTGFTRHFTHLKSGDQTKDKHLLLTTILGDTINQGLIKMAEPCPDTTYAKLAWLQTWHIRDETCGARACQCAVPTSLCRTLGRRHRLVVGRSELPNRQQGREHRAHQAEIRQQSRADLLHPYIRPVRAVSNQGGQRRRARFDLRSRRFAVPRVQPAHRGALHRHGWFHRSRLRLDAPARLPLRAAHPRPGRHYSSTSRRVTSVMTG